MTFDLSFGHSLILGSFRLTIQPGNGMPANLTPEVELAGQGYRDAWSDKEHMVALLLMLATILKDKGIETLLAENRA